MIGAMAGSLTPTSWYRVRDGLVSGPRKLKTVGTPSSLRTGPTKRMAGWKRWAKQNPMPASATQRATPSGPSSMATPSASSTSAVPDRRGGGPVAVLADRHAAPGDDEGGQGGDVDAAQPVAAGADQVDHHLRRPQAERAAARRRRPWPGPTRSPLRSSRPWRAAGSRKAPICAGVASPDSTEGQRRLGLRRR